MSNQDNNSNVVGGGPYFATNGWANNAFIQFAGFTFGKTTSFFDFDTMPYSNQTNQWGSNQSGNGIPVWAYTAQFGNGISASISAEDNVARQTSIANVGIQNTNANGYNGKSWPDIVANLRRRGVGGRRRGRGDRAGAAREPSRGGAAGGLRPVLRREAPGRRRGAGSLRTDLRREGRAVGRSPQVSVVTGASAGGGCYSPALTDFVVMTE